MPRARTKTNCWVNCEWSSTNYMSWTWTKKAIKIWPSSSSKRSRKWYVSLLTTFLIEDEYVIDTIEQRMEDDEYMSQEPICKVLLLNLDSWKSIKYFVRIFNCVLTDQIIGGFTGWKPVKLTWAGGWSYSYTGKFKKGYKHRFEYTADHNFV